MHALLQQLAVQISREVGGLDADSAQQSPGDHPQQWTAQQVIEHLILTCRTTRRALERRLRKGLPMRTQKGTWLERALQTMILRVGHLPQGAVTLDETRPEPGEFAPMNGEQLMSVLYEEMSLMDLALERCRVKFGTSCVASHPWLGPLRVAQWRRFHVVHGHHHVKQLRAVIAKTSPSKAVIMAPVMSATHPVYFPGE